MVTLKILEVKTHENGTKNSWILDTDGDTTSFKQVIYTSSSANMPILITTGRKLSRQWVKYQ